MHNGTAPSPQPGRPWVTCRVRAAGAERHCQCLGGMAAPRSWSPPPRGPRAGLRLLQRCLSVSAALCGHELGAASPLLAGAAFQHWEISGDGGRGCFNSGFWGGNALNKGGGTLRKVGETQSRRRSELGLSIPTPTPNSEARGTTGDERAWRRGSSQPRFVNSISY